MTYHPKAIDYHEVRLIAHSLDYAAKTHLFDREDDDSDHWTCVDLARYWKKRLVLEEALRIVEHLEED